MAVDCTRVLWLVVGLGPGVAVAEVRGRRGGPLVVGVELTGRPCCGGCGGKVHRHGAGKVSLADLPAFGRPVRLEWNKRRWLCPDRACAVRTFTDQDPAVALPRARMTSRAARHATRRAGLGRAVSEIAADPGTGWHTVMRAVHRWGRALLGADPGRAGGVSALGLDEILMFRRGPFREKHWGTTIVDVRRGILLDIVAGRSAAGAKNWIDRRTPQWRKRIRWAVMDLSGPYRKAFGGAVPHAAQAADPFHVVRLADSAIDDVRRRVHNETTGGRGTKGDPLYRTRRLLLKAAERISDRGRTKLVGLLAAGDPRGEVRDAWHAKETLRGIYRIPDRDLAAEALDELARDLRDETYSPEPNKLGRTLNARRAQIANRHRPRVTNGPTEAANNLAKLIKRAPLGNPRLRPLQNPNPALRRQTRPDPARHPHPTPKREDRKSSSLPAESVELLADAATTGFVVGGTGAVPSSKLPSHIEWTRLSGKDRVETFQLAIAQYEHVRSGEAEKCGVLGGSVGKLDGRDHRCADLMGYDLRCADFSEAVFAGADLTGANLSGADLSGADLSGATLKNARLHRTNLSRADLSDARMAGAVLTEADLTDSDLTGAYLRGNRVHVYRSSSCRGAQYGDHFADADPAGANLTGANLSGADLTDAFLGGWQSTFGCQVFPPADLTDTVLTDASLLRANLFRVDLTRSNLNRANLASAYMDGAILRGARLVNANLLGASLENVDWRGTQTDGCDGCP